MGLVGEMGFFYLLALSGQGGVKAEGLACFEFLEFGVYVDFVPVFVVGG